MKKKIDIETLNVRFDKLESEYKRILLGSKLSFDEEMEDGFKKAKDIRDIIENIRVESFK